MFIYIYMLILNLTQEHISNKMGLKQQKMLINA